MRKIKSIIGYFASGRISLGACAIIKNSKGEILLGKREKKHLIYPNKWNLPGGLLDYKEYSEDSVKREVEEEIGVKIKIIKKGNVYENLPKKNFNFHTITFTYHCKISSGKPKPLDETNDVKWFKPSEIKKLNLAYNHKEILREENLLN